MQINVSRNYRKLSRSLANLGRRQAPFAIAKTLKETMNAVDRIYLRASRHSLFNYRYSAVFCPRCPASPPFKCLN